MKRLSLQLMIIVVLFFMVVTVCIPISIPAATLAPDTSPTLREAWKAEWDKELALVKQEGKVTIYTSWSTKMRTVVGQPFKNRYGVELEVMAGRTSELLAKINAEKRAGMNLVDINISGPGNHLEMKKGGFLQPIEPLLLLPEVTDKKKWEGGKLHFFDNDKLVFLLGSEVMRLIIINTELVKPPIQSARDLLDSRWKGRIALLNPTRSGGSGTILTMAAETFGEDFLWQLANQIPVITDDYRTLAEWVAKGKYAIGIGSSVEITKGFVDAGAPLTPAVLKDLEYVGSSANFLSVHKKLAHPNATKVFLNWLLTKEGQTAWVKFVGSQSLRLDVTTEYTAPERIRQPGVKYYNTATEDFEIIKEKLRLKSREIFSKSLK